MDRSLLFVPGDSERKIVKSQDSGADLIILDLEDSVAAANKPRAREIVRDYLAATLGKRPAKLFVRINPLDTGEALHDLVAIMPAAPDGIVQPKPKSADDAIALGRYLDALEVQNRLVLGATRILPVATEQPAAIFTISGYDRVGARLAGVTWGAEDLASSIGAMGNRRDDGEWSEPFALARSLCLFAASAAGVPAVDTVHADFRDEQGLFRAATRARRDGFSGMLAIHPAQVPILNAAFSPTAAEVEEAEQIVALFDASPGAGALALNGRMIDMPHLIQARKIIALSRRG